MKKILRVLLDPRWVYILPVLHLAGCIATYITRFEWLPVLISELPIGFLLVGLAWRYGNPLLWCGLFGTLWWCWLARMFFRYLSRSD